MKEFIKSIGNELFIGVISSFITAIFINRKNFKLYVLSHTIYYKKYIRASLSYLYKIKCNDKYLLVKNRKIEGQYQPVGGVYKYFESARQNLNKLEVIDCSGFAYEDNFKNDLRIKVPGKSLMKFLKWFESREDRELDPIREFYEELIAKNILNKDTFAYFDYRFVKQERTPIHYSQHYKTDEIIIYTIYELIPNPKQEEELKKIIAIESDYYKWFTCSEIEQLGHTEQGDFRIGEHSKYIL